LAHLSVADVGMFNIARFTQKSNSFHLDCLLESTIWL